MAIILFWQGVRRSPILRSVSRSRCVATSMASRAGIHRRAVDRCDVAALFLHAVINVSASWVELFRVDG
jgi:hypothetical protein